MSLAEPPDLLDIKAALLGGSLYKYAHVEKYIGKWGAVPAGFLNTNAAASFGVFETKQEALDRLVQVTKEIACAGSKSSA